MGSPTLYYGVVPDIILMRWDHLIQYTLPGAVGEAVSKATFENYHHASKVTTNWG